MTMAGIIESKCSACKKKTAEEPRGLAPWHVSHEATQFRVVGHGATGPSPVAPGMRCVSSWEAVPRGQAPWLLENEQKLCSIRTPRRPGEVILQRLQVGFVALPAGHRVCVHRLADLELADCLHRARVLVKGQTAVVPRQSEEVN